jgi:hypothetical protein
MSPEMELRHKLAALTRRLRLLAIERRISWCLLPGLVLALLLLAAHKLDRLDEPYFPMAAVLAVALAVGLAWGLLKPVSLFDAAALADRRLGLKERLSNAVVFVHSPDASPLVPALLRDAARCAGRISPNEVAPHRMTRSTLHCGVVAVLLAAASFAPVYPLGRSPQEVAVRKEMREQGKKLSAAAKRMQEEAAKKGLQTPAELAKKLEKLAKELEKAKLSKKQALLKTGKLAAELREAQKRAALSNSAGKFAKAAQSLTAVPFLTDAGRSVSQAIHERKLDDLAAKLDELAQQLRDGKLSSASERERLARDLQKMAEAMEAAGLDGMAGALGKAAEAVREGKAASAAEALEDAARQAAELGEQAAESASLEQMAEELEQSQQEVAQADQAEKASCPSCGSQTCPGAKPGGT